MKLVDVSDSLEYNFEMVKKGDHIHFMIKENNLYTPFTFECDYTMEDFIKQHKAFKACDDLEEILNHLYRLYDNGKVELKSAETSNEKFLIFKIWNISEEMETQPFRLVFKITEKKDDDLAMLYEIQNMHVEQLKRIKLIIKKKMAEDNPLKKELLELIGQSHIHI